MSRTLIESEIDDILKNTETDSMRGFGDPIFAKKLDAYTYILKSQHKKVDIKRNTINLKDRNKGDKGEFLLCGIIDLTMWRLGYHLGRDYAVISHYNGTAKSRLPGIDFRLTCNNQIFLCEAKNWPNTDVNKRTYQKKIQKRFRFPGINVLMINEDKIQDVMKYIQKFPPLNGQPIHYIGIPYHMLRFDNNEMTLCDNLLWGVEQLADIIYYNGGKKYVDRDYTLDECLQMRMPSVFISDYIGKSQKTVQRQAKKLNIRRNSSIYRSSIKYRRIC